MSATSIAAIAPERFRPSASRLGVQVIKRRGPLHDRRTVVAGDTEIRARRFVIATGSSPVVPPIPGLDAGRLPDQRDGLRPDRRPGHLIIIGGGPVGLELAQAFRRLGSEVTVIEAARPLATRGPRDGGGRAAGALRAEGVAIREGDQRRRASSGAARPASGCSSRRAGREHASTAAICWSPPAARPNVDGLDLEKAGIALRRASGIEVDSRLRTTNRRVYAIGDVDRRAAIHPCRRLPRRPRAPRAAVPPAGQGRPRRSSRE